MKSPKTEGEFTSPNQASAAVSIGKSNIKTPKSEMLDYSLSSDTKIGIKTFKSKMSNYRNLPSDSKSEIKNPKTEQGSNDEDEDEEHDSPDEDEEHESSPAENNLDEEEWVTVFGIIVMLSFHLLLVILDYVCQGNWMHILYQNQREAQKALSKSGKKISEVLIFFVLAATGNVYTVTLSTTPVCRCNCPDSVVPCKHILFVFLRVLGISQNDRRLCRKRLKPCQLADLLNLPSSARTLADAYTRDKFRHLYTTAKVKVGLPPSIGNGVLCAICHAKWHPLGDHEMVKCGSCGDIGHKTCLVTYRRSHGKVVPKCKSCRTNWVAAVQNWYTKLTR
ncbi:hypothetical protein MKW98_026940 [Papaver atlanticum]|uniref:SWIM-type domain-containing protein n=1 Tax=Papaver atlanticum TaxID=357466 RepID=A0AAD4XJ82_9MAGN|nr:hypothetical protein MKW98_026940 [Papaver atlanticum]